MKRIGIVLMLLLFVMSMTTLYATAEPLLTLNTTNGIQGGTASLDMSISGDTDSYAGINARIVLPDGVSVTNVSAGAGLSAGSFTIDHAALSANGRNEVSVVAYSASSTFSGDSGVLLTFALAVANNAESGDVKFLEEGEEPNPLIRSRHAISNNDGSASVAHSTNNGFITIDLSGDIDTDNDGIPDSDDPDDDNDGMPDSYEIRFGLNPLVDDSNDDLDGDGINNLQEYQDGTNPGSNPFAVAKVSSKITSGIDDVEQRQNGTMYTNSSDLELVDDTKSNQVNQTVGLIFRNINVPQGAIITNAYIQFTTDEVSTGVCNVEIKGENTDNPVDFTNNVNDVSLRSSTIASVGWSPADWNTIGESGEDQKTPNINIILQEIVDRSGWVANNSINIIITGTGRRTAKSSNGNASEAAELVVEYIQASNTNSVTSIINSGIDDVEEELGGTMDINSSDLEMVDKGSNNQTIGLIFRNINVPKGVTITNAYIEFTTDELSTGICNLEIRGEDVDNPADFTNSANDVSLRITTFESVNWSPGDWNTVGESGELQKTPNMNAIIQEIVDRSGWTPNNSINIIITGIGKRTAEAFESGFDTAAKLFVEYSTD